MKWNFEGLIEGEIEVVAGGEPQVGQPFHVTIWRPEKVVSSYSGVVTRITDDTIFFER